MTLTFNTIEQTTHQTFDPAKNNLMNIPTPAREDIQFRRTRSPLLGNFDNTAQVMGWPTIISGIFQRILPS